MVGTASNPPNCKLYHTVTHEWKAVDLHSKLPAAMLVQHTSCLLVNAVELVSTMSSNTDLCGHSQNLLVMACHSHHQ